MPIDKDFKRLVRQRMTETGERYTDARSALVNTSMPPQRTTAAGQAPTTEHWIELLGHPQENERAFRLLQRLPPEELRPLAISGTRHADAKVRRRSCQLLDDLALTPATVAALEVCATDPEPRVRAAALHTLACEACKPDGVCLDQRVIAERAVNDSSAEVRRGVAMGLTWNRTQSDDWAVAMATRLLLDSSAEIRRFAQQALDRIERQHRTDAERQQLPEPLRTKTERHAGKWVAVVDGRIAAVNPPPSWRWRHRDAQLYFVTPSSTS